MRLLRIDSSARLSSVSRRLIKAFVTAWQKPRPDGEIVRRDLPASAIPPISDEWVVAARTDPAGRNAAEHQALALWDQLINELESAHVILIGAPMYNFTISAPLKAWIDQVVRPGRTVQDGPQEGRGLLQGKKVAAPTSRGGAYSESSSRSSLDYQVPYLRAIFDLIGLTDGTFIHAENQLRPDQADLSCNEAIWKINEFVLLTWAATREYSVQ